MEKIKNVLQKLLYLPGIIKFLMTAVSAAGLIYVFMNGLDEHPIAYVIYVFSFYTLCAVSVSVPSVIKKCRRLLYDNHHTARYLNEAELRTRVSLYCGTVINIAYSVFKLFTGIYYRSVWFGAAAVYYMVLCMIRFFLIKNDRKNILITTQEEQRLHGLKSYRICGLLLLILNASITGMVFQMIWQNKGYSYPGFVIYASAAYTFYRMTMAIIRTVKKTKNPVLSAVKSMDLCIALMSIFALQTAMFASFGGDLSDARRQLMNALTGGAVCLIVVCIAVFMIIRSNNELKHINNQEVFENGK